MSFYEIVRRALTLSRQRGVFSSARFLRRTGVCAEDRRKVLGAIRRAHAPA